jgi:hypothetical protein
VGDRKRPLEVVVLGREQEVLLAVADDEARQDHDHRALAPYGAMM